MLDLAGRVSIYQPEQEGLIFPEIPETEYRGRKTISKRTAGCRVPCLCLAEIRLWLCRPFDRARSRTSRIILDQSDVCAF